MPGRGAGGAGRASPVVQIYATSSGSAEAALSAVAHAAPGVGVRLHIEGRDGPCAPGRPVLMAMLADATTGDIVCGAADAFAAAPPRARSRLTAIVKARGVGLALTDDAETLMQVALGAEPGPSLRALAQVSGLRPAPNVVTRPQAAAAPTLDLEARVLHLLNQGHSWRQVQSRVGAPRAVIAKCAKRLAAIESAQSAADFASSRAAGFAGGDRDDGDADPPGAGSRV